MSKRERSASLDASDPTLYRTGSPSSSASASAAVGSDVTSSSLTPIQDPLLSISEEQLEAVFQAASAASLDIRLRFRKMKAKDRAEVWLFLLKGKVNKVEEEKRLTYHSLPPSSNMRIMTHHSNRQESPSIHGHCSPASMLLGALCLNSKLRERRPNAV